MTSFQRARRLAIACTLGGPLIVMAGAASAADVSTAVQDDAPIATSPSADAGAAASDYANVLKPARPTAAAPAAPVPVGIASASTPAQPTSSALPLAPAASQRLALDDERPFPPQPLPTAPPQRFTNTLGRDVELIVSLEFNQRSLGELPVTVTRDNRVLVHSAEFEQLVGRLLNDAGRKAVAAALGSRPTFEMADLAPSGVKAVFDSGALSVVILAISPNEQLTQALFAQSNPSDQVVLAPLPFSAYLNINGDASYATGQGVAPFLDMQGAFHYRQAVLEYDFQGQRNGVNRQFGVDRRYIRLVYDVPDKDLRFFAGDLSPLFRNQQGFVQMGGVGLARTKTLFDPFRSFDLTGNDKLLLQNDAVVDVYDNGSLYRELRLNAGSYNLNNPPIQTGSNQIELRVRDSTGLTQTISYNAFLDSFDLEPGDYEYAAYVGQLARQAFSTPVYTSETAFTGFYRKALLDGKTLGVGLQTSRSVTMVDGQIRFVLPAAARLELDGGYSTTKLAGDGYLIAATYTRLFLRDDRNDAIYLRVQYETPHFAQLGNPNPQNQTSWQFSGTYNHNFSAKLATSLNAAYALHTGVQPPTYSVRWSNYYRANRHWTFDGGLSYRQTDVGVGLPGTKHNFGVFLGVAWQPTPDQRATVRYDSERQDVTGTYTKAIGTNVGAYGYNLVVQHSPGASLVGGQIDYIANRFDASLSATTAGDDFSHIGHGQVVTLRAGTSLAYAGGEFAIGRRIFDSFAIAYPHPSLGDHQVIVGPDLQLGKYIARSGKLGPALDPDLPSYVDQPVRYDVLDAPPGYDLGSGVIVTHPSYRSGYALQIGVDAFMSAAGTLVGNTGKPVALVSGHVTAMNDAKAQSQQFFTNSVGRFAITGLKPGVRYRVDLTTRSPASFEFETPKSKDALVNLDTVTLTMPTE